MPVQLDRNGLEVLDREECVRLLASARLGHIGFTSGALPSVLPVNFHVDQDRILVHTTRGSRLDGALKDAVVAFEAEQLDPSDQSGWSVAVTGVATELDDTSVLGASGREGAPVWAPPGREAVLAISIDLVSGRRTAEAVRFSAETPATP
jgi:hypothetical protein